MKAVLFAAALAVPSVATAQKAKCLTPDEAQALVTYALPSVVRAVSTQCAKTLPATASLVQSGPLIASRYQPEADRAWPMAKVAVDKVAGLQITDRLGKQGADGLLEVALTSGLADSIKPADCPVVDRIMSALEPLPARNMAMLVVTALEFSGKGDKKPPLNICRPETAAR